MSRFVIALVVLGVLAQAACHERRASVEECGAIFDRLVVLELAEMGFDDPALAERRQRQLATSYRGELAECVGRRLPAQAMACVAEAETAEEVSHDCLR